MDTSILARLTEPVWNPFFNDEIAVDLHSHAVMKHIGTVFGHLGSTYE